MAEEESEEAPNRESLREKLARWRESKYFWRRVIGASVVLAIIVVGILLAPSSNYRELVQGPVFDLTETNQLPAPYDLEDSEGSWVVLTSMAVDVPNWRSVWLRLTDDEYLYRGDTADNMGEPDYVRSAEYARQVSLNVAMGHVSDDAGVWVVPENSSGDLPPGSRVLVDGSGPALLAVLPDGEFVSIPTTEDVEYGVEELDAPEFENHGAPLDPAPDAISSDAFGLQDVGGGSAALIQALAWVDVLTEGDMTGGMNIAVTGGLEADGTVVEVSSIQLKLDAAAEEDTDLVIVPEGALDGVAVPEGLNVVEVDTFEGAVEAVEDAS